MKRALVFIAALMFWSGAFADQVLRQGANTMRLSTAPCANEGILAQIEPKWRDKFRRAHAVINGKQWAACWIGEHQAGVYVLFEDGDEARFAWSQFKDEPGV